jgi:hypothetical protein
MVLYLFMGLASFVFVGLYIVMVSLQLSGRKEDWSADMEKILNEDISLLEIKSEDYQDTGELVASFKDNG